MDYKYKRLSLIYIYIYIFKSNSISVSIFCFTDFKYYLKTIIFQWLYLKFIHFIQTDITS